MMETVFSVQLVDLWMETYHAKGPCKVKSCSRIFNTAGWCPTSLFKGQWHSHRNRVTADGGGWQLMPLCQGDGILLLPSAELSPQNSDPSHVSEPGWDPSAAQGIMRLMWGQGLAAVTTG